jgi:outer membrane beta-barrel protein
MRRVALAASLLASLVGTTGRAADADPGAYGPADAAKSQDTHLVAIQNRRFQLDHELTVSGGVLPVDAYYKGVTATGSYTIHFSPSWAWEVAQVTWAYNVQTDLMRKLIQVSNAQGGRNSPAGIPAIQWIAATHLVVKPLYGKQALFNTQVLHLEAYLQAGPAVVVMTGAERKYDLGVDIGGGLRFWLTEGLSTRFDLGEMVYFHDPGCTPSAGSTTASCTGGSSTRVRQALMLRLGLSFTFGGDE